MVFERYAFNRVHRTRTGEHGSPPTIFTFNFQLARGQSHAVTALLLLVIFLY